MTTVSKPETPAERKYGSKPGRVALVIIGVLTAVAAAGVGIIAGSTGQSPGVMPQMVTYSISDSSVKTNFMVAKGKDDEVHCTVDAFGHNFAVLAQKLVVVPAGTSSYKGTETLQTEQRANGARIHSCRKV